MATLKQRMWRKNNAGTYDTIHLETESSLVLRPSGRTVEQDLTDFLPEVQATDDVPETLHFGRLHTNNKRPYIGSSDETPKGIVMLTDAPLSYEETNETSIPPEATKKILFKDMSTGEKLRPLIDQTDLPDEVAVFTEYDGTEPPSTLEMGKGIITTDNKVYLGGVGNVPVELTGSSLDLSEYMEAVVGTP